MSILVRAAEALPNWLRRFLLRNRVMWEVRNRLSRTVRVHLDEPLADVEMWLPEWYANTYGGHFVEPTVVKYLCENVRPGSIVADVGTFAGIYTILLSRLVGPNGRVYAVEPVVENFELLKANVAAAGCTNVRAVLAAAGAEDAPVTFRRMRGRHLPYGTLAGEIDDPTRYESVQVSGIKLDTLFRDEGVSSVALIKIDVEAAEGMVMRGLRETVSQSQPTLVVEIHDAPLHDARRAREILPLLFDSGYAVYDLDEDPTLARPIQSPSHWSGHHHCIAVRRAE